MPEHRFDAAEPAHAPRPPQDGPARGHARPGSTRKAAGFIIALVLVMLGGGALAAVLMKGGGGPVTPQELSARSEAPPTGAASQPLPASNRALMGLQPLTAAAAPGFTLTDQHGHAVSLDSLDRTHAVVLAFMDDRCTDICPIVGQEIADAYHDLGRRAAGVEFVAVNVNAAHNATYWLRSFIAEKAPALASVPTFHYLTGPPGTLRKVWASYHITVKVDPATGKVYHSEGMYFIAPGGAKRYQATPFANLRKSGTGWLPPATITQWGRGIAQYAKAAGRPASGQP